MTSTIIDLFIRIKNGYMSGKPEISGIYSKMNQEILTILKKHHYIEDFSLIKSNNKAGSEFKIKLLYSHNKPALTNVKIISKPGKRIYQKSAKLETVLGGLGILIVSTSKGLMIGQQAKKEKIGGEVLASIW